MLWFLLRYLLGLVVTSTLTYGTFVSKINCEINEYPENPLHDLITSKPWKFDININANQSIGFNVSLQNDAYFAAVQVHSFVNEIILEDNTGKLQCGTNLGYVNVVTSGNCVYFTVHNTNRFPVKILGFVTPYGLLAPLPGACLPSKETIDSTLHLQISEHLINLTFHKALIVNFSTQTCSSDNILYKLYYMYTPEKDFSEATYFQAIETMMIPNLREKEASQYYLGMLNRDNGGTFKILLAKYPGTGLVLNLIAESNNHSSSYVVAHNFGCNFTVDRPSCFYLGETAHRVEIMILCGAGLILCFCGYEWKSFELAVMTFLLISLITYTSLYNVLSVDAKVSASVVAGVIVGFIFAITLLFTNSAHFRHCVSFLVFGLLMASSLFYYSGLGNIAFFKVREIYWSHFFAVTIITILLLYLNPTSSHYITSSTIGSFLTVITLDYFAGSSLKFVFLDNIRRVAVDHFSEAYISPPFQTPDIIWIVLWLTLAILTMAYQCYRHRFLSSLENSTNNTSPGGTDSSFNEKTPLLDPEEEVQ